MAEQKKDLTTSFNIGQILADALSSPNSPGGYIASKWGDAGGNIGQGIANVLTPESGGAGVLRGLGRIGSVFGNDAAQALSTVGLPADKQFVPGSDQGFLGTVGAISNAFTGEYPSWSPQAEAMQTKKAIAAETSPDKNLAVKMMTEMMKNTKRPEMGSGVPSDLYASATAKDIKLTPQENATLYGMLSGMGDAGIDPRLGTGQNILQVALKGLGGFAQGAKSNTDLLNEQAKLNAQLQQQTFNNKLGAAGLMAQGQNARNQQALQMYAMDRAALMGIDPKMMQPQISQAALNSGNPYAIDALAKSEASVLNDEDLQKTLAGLSGNPQLQTAVKNMATEKAFATAPMNAAQRNAVLQALQMQNLITGAKSGLY